MVISRLVYRKGVDLLAGLIPVMCAKYPNVQFLIGGDGPKRIQVEEVVERHCLQDRVTLLGAVQHEHVREVLVQGDIFLNSSLTEAFCMAIVEAAACGLQVVSTNVGGIPEVLPKDMIWLAEASVSGLVAALDKAIRDRDRRRVVEPFECHARIKRYYQWTDIAQRTQTVYDAIMEDDADSLNVRVKKLMKCGLAFGLFYVTVHIIEHFLSVLYAWLVPAANIDKCPDLTYDLVERHRNRARSKAAQ